MDNITALLALNPHMQLLGCLAREPVRLFIYSSIFFPICRTPFPVRFPNLHFRKLPDG